MKVIDLSTLVVVECNYLINVHETEVHCFNSDLHKGSQNFDACCYILFLVESHHNGLYHVSRYGIFQHLKMIEILLFYILIFTPPIDILFHKYCQNFSQSTGVGSPTRPLRDPATGHSANHRPG